MAMCYAAISQFLSKMTGKGVDLFVKLEHLIITAISMKYLLTWCELRIPKREVHTQKNSLYSSMPSVYDILFIRVGNSGQLLLKSQRNHK
jgi:hypothetical protein